MGRTKKTIVKYKKRKQTKIYRNPSKGYSQYKGNLAIKRVSNMATAAGFTVDASVCNKGSNDIIVISSATAATKSFGYFTFNAQLGDVPNYGEFTQLYDQYKIVGCRLRLIPYATGALTGAAAAAAAQQSAVFIHSVIDRDDVAASTASEAGVNAIRQYTSYRCTNPFKSGGRGFKAYFKPRVATAVYRGAFTGYKNEAWGWCDCDYVDVQGYGLKAIVEVLSGGSAIPLFFKVEITFYLKFRNPR